MISDPNKINSISANARAKRVAKFSALCKNCAINGASVLDIGGTVDFWKTNAHALSPGQFQSIDVVNLPPCEEITFKIENIDVRQYPGNALDRHSVRRERYDVVFSNSVIEHVGNLRSQAIMAKHIIELSKYYFIQTPYRFFPLEPHFYVPFFSLLPLGVRTFMHQRYNLGFMPKNPDWLQARMACEDTRLLSVRELRAIFRDGRGTVIKERLMGLCKSIIATNML